MSIQEIYDDISDQIDGACWACVDLHFVSDLADALRHQEDDHHDHDEASGAWMDAAEHAPSALEGEQTTYIL